MSLRASVAEGKNPGHARVLLTLFRTFAIKQHDCCLTLPRLTLLSLPFPPCYPELFGSGLGTGEVLDLYGAAGRN